jgi:hypothetical protein
LTSNNFDWNEVPSDIYSIFPLTNEPSLSHAGQVKHLVSKALIQHQPWVMNTRLFFIFYFSVVAYLISLLKLASTVDVEDYGECSNNSKFGVGGNDDFEA